MGTKRWGNENSWTFGNCASGQVYGNNQIYTEECCQPEGDYQLVCKDEYGDGWHGGFLRINGERYCKKFKNGHEKVKEVTMSGTPDQPTEAPTQAPTAGPTQAPPPQTDCGIVVGSIVGGSEVTPYSLPWQVGLVSPGSDRTWCGGALIGPSHVLTAAHCMGGDFDIIVGEHDLTSTEDGTRHTVCSTTIHPDYNSGTLNNDYAIVRLTEPVQIGARAIPACLPIGGAVSFDGNFLDDKSMTVSGWGRL